MVTFWSKCHFAKCKMCVNFFSIDMKNIFYTCELFFSTWSLFVMHTFVCQLFITHRCTSLHIETHHDHFVVTLLRDATARHKNWTCASALAWWHLFLWSNDSIQHAAVAHVERTDTIMDSVTSRTERLDVAVSECPELRVRLSSKATSVLPSADPSALTRQGPVPVRVPCYGER